MKGKFLFLNFALAAMTASMFIACSSDDSIDLGDGSVKIAPAKSPDLVLYSGSNVLYSTFKTKALTRSEDYAYYKLQDYNFDHYFPVEAYKETAKDLYQNHPVTDEEKAYVKEYLAAHPNEGSTECDLTDYFIQYAGSSHATYRLQYIQGDGNVHHEDYQDGSSHMDYIVLDDVHQLDYNANYGPDALVIGCPINGGQGPTYHDSYASLTQTNHYQYYYIEYNGETNLYLCFDYATAKYDNGQLDFPGDGIYNDYVIKVTPADGSKVVAPDPDPDPEPVVEPDDPEEGTDEVEVNLSLNDEKTDGDYIATKLSIHVRSITDVEVFIPAPAEYYCDADDMYIVLSHKDEAYKYGDNSNVTTYEVNGNPVTLTVKYEADGIRVTTDGINESVINYLKETYGDGITFEVWNYYNSSITDEAGNAVDVTRDQLQTLLNNSTVSFLDADPSQYINAYGALSNYEGEIKAIVGEDGLYYPVDATTGDVLPSEYWTREPADSKYYALYTHVNTLDCQVVPTDGSWVKQTSTADDPTNYSSTKYNVVYKK